MRPFWWVEWSFMLWLIKRKCNDLLKIRQSFLFPSIRLPLSKFVRISWKISWEHYPATFFYLWWHSSRVGWGGLTRGVKFVSDKGSSGTTSLGEFVWIVDSDLSPSYEEKSEVQGLPWACLPTSSVCLSYAWNGVGKKGSLISSPRALRTWNTFQRSVVQRVLRMFVGSRVGVGLTWSTKKPMCPFF